MKARPHLVFAAALAGMLVLTACAKSEEPAPAPAPQSSNEANSAPGTTTNFENPQPPAEQPPAEQAPPPSDQ